MTLRALVLSAALVLPYASALAQDATTNEPESEVADEIVVTGQIRGGDPAMSAFLAGDYVTAEIEFEKNFATIRRAERNFEAGVERAALDTITSEVGTARVDAGQTDTRSDTLNSSISNITLNRSRPDNSDNVVTSGRDKGFQLYMSGMSEMRQGKIDEAEESLKRALRFNEYLHDARVKLSLLRIQRGDMDYARDQLGYLLRLQKRCGDGCRRAEDINDAVEQLTPFVR